MIRPMSLQDKDRVLEILRDSEVFTCSEIAVAEELIDIFLKSPAQKDYKVVVLESERGKVIGFMTYGPAPLSEGGYDLYWVGVSPREQSQGHGKKMVHWLEEHVRGENGRVILVETSSRQEYDRARRFYIGLGYREVARTPDFYKTGDDRVVYAKYYR